MSGPRKSTYQTTTELTGFNVKVADNIKRLRNARKLSRPALAELAGLPARAIENAETGYWTHSFWTIAKLSASFRVPVSAFTAVNDQ